MLSSILVRVAALLFTIISDASSQSSSVTRFSKLGGFASTDLSVRLSASFSSPFYTLTPNSRRQYGLVFQPTSVRLNNVRSFYSAFSFSAEGGAGSQADPLNNPPALGGDGLAFFITTSPNASFSNPNAFGFNGSAATNPQSLVVKFDTYHNGGADISGNFVAAYKPPFTTLNTLCSKVEAFAFNSGGDWNVSVTYTAPTLKVDWWSIAASRGPAYHTAPQMNCSFDLGDLMPVASTNVSFGVFAMTGAASVNDNYFNNHTLKTFQYTVCNRNNAAVNPLAAEGAYVSCGCLPGFELVDDTCSMCQSGFYKAAIGDYSCTPCPNICTTAGTGSASSAECSCPDNIQEVVPYYPAQFSLSDFKSKSKLTFFEATNSEIVEDYILLTQSKSSQRGMIVSRDILPMNNAWTAIFSIRMGNAYGALDTNAIKGGIAAGGNGVAFFVATSKPTVNSGLTGFAVVVDTFSQTATVKAQEGNTVFVISNPTNLSTIFYQTPPESSFANLNTASFNTPFNTGNLWHFKIKYAANGLSIFTQQSDNPIPVFSNNPAGLVQITQPTAAFIGFYADTPPSSYQYHLLQAFSYSAVGATSPGYQICDPITAVCQCTEGAYYDSSSSRCTACPISYFKPLSGFASACMACDTGTTTASSGSTMCVCAQGFFGANGSSCRSCPANSYTSVADSLACTVCPINSMTTGKESKTCVCKPGFFGNAIKASCLPCPDGTVKESAGNGLSDDLCITTSNFFSGDNLIYVCVGAGGGFLLLIFFVFLIATMRARNRKQTERKAMEVNQLSQLSPFAHFNNLPPSPQSASQAPLMGGRTSQQRSYYGPQQVPGNSWQSQMSGTPGGYPGGGFPGGPMPFPVSYNNNSRAPVVRSLTSRSYGSTPGNYLPAMTTNPYMMNPANLTPTQKMLGWGGNYSSTQQSENPDGDDVDDPEEEVDDKDDPCRTQTPEHAPVAYPAYIEIDPTQELQMVKKVREGGFGELWIANLTNEELVRKWGVRAVAVKTLKQQKKSSKKKSEKSSMIEFQHEVSVTYALQHSKNVMKLYACSRKPLAMVMKLYKCSLSDLIHNPKFEQNGLVRPKVIGSITLDMINGLASMHDLGMAHLDIKPGNMLLEEIDPKDTPTGIPFRLVLCDFGLTRLLSGLDDIKAKPKTLAKGISYQYASPEAFGVFMLGQNAEPVTYMKIDVFAFAASLYEMLTQRLPWGHMKYHEVETALKDGGRPDWAISKKPLKADKLMSFMKELADQAWQQAPRDRPSFGELKETLEPVLLRYKDRR